MLKRVLRFLYNHFCENKSLYVITFAASIVGVLLGISGGKSFSDSEYLSAFFGGLDGLSHSTLVFRAFCSAFLISAAAVVFGFSPFGIAVIPLIDAYRGFAVGYLASAFYSVYGFKSIVFILIALVIPSLLWLPPLVFASVNSVRASISMIKICRRKTSPDFSVNTRFMLISCVIMFVFMLFARLAEIYIIPPILNVVCGLYI